MDRDQLAELVRAAARITGGRELVVVGSAALLASVAEPRGELEASDVVDLFAREHPELGAAIDAALGAGSMFHDERGFCARAVGPLTPIAPRGWIDRLVPIDLGDGILALCMAPHDLVISKLVVGRGKDVEYCVAALELGIVERGALEELVEMLPVEASQRDEVARTLDRLDG